MKKFFVALATFITVGAANAADLPRAPIYKAAAGPAAVSWTGFYIGANGGGGWSRGCWNFIGTVPAVGLPAPLDEGCNYPRGGMIGAQVGFNWQTGPMVVGLEAQGNWALQGENVSLLPSPPFPPSINRTRVDGLGLFAGRLGFA